MNIKILHKGFNYSQDGPGNRLIYHLQGCNFHCRWCSNPESIAINGSVMIPNDAPKDTDCPLGAVKNKFLDRSFCEKCSEKPCRKIYGNRITVTGKDTDTDEVMREIISGKMMYFSGGGVTFTGGEPTLQSEALAIILSECKKEKIHTAIETNCSSDKIISLSENIDYLIADCKHYDNEKHKEFVGASNESVINNLRELCKMREQIKIRIPLIGGFNSSEKDAEKFSDLFNGFDNKNLLVEVLRYHEFGKDKWSQCGMEYKMENGNVSDSEYGKFIDVLTKNGINITKS